MKTLIKSAALAAMFTISALANAQRNSEPLDTQVGILFGMSQPLLLSGFNIEGNFFWRRLAFDYSHGASLDFSGSAITGELADQKLAMHWPYSTGLGVGYRFSEWFNLRVEPKWHRHQIYYEGDALRTENIIADYNTFSLGIGAYVNWRPFKNSDNLLQGITIAPSVRYWPRLGSTLADNKLEYFNVKTERMETHNAVQPGIANSPLIINVSVGYSFVF